MKGFLYPGISALLIAFILLPLSTFSQQSFEDYKKQQKQAFGKFVEDEEAAFAKYKADVEEKWR